MNAAQVLTLQIFLIFCIQFTIANRYNVTFSDLAVCREYRIEDGYQYRNFFLVENIQNNQNENEKLRLKFYVMAPSNAHILLSAVDNPKKGDTVYEIVIGAGNNAFAAIRSKIGGNQVSTKKQNGVLKSTDPTPIIVVQKVDGTLEVIIPTFVEPFLSYKDPKPLHVKYVSFSSYGTVSARWFYDCVGDKAADLEMEKRNLTNLERLQNDLFKEYNTYTIPNGLSKIYMGISITGISYDTKRSVFQTRLELKMKWSDSNLVWNPAEYGNITTIATFDANPWSPSLLIMNGAGSTFTNFDPKLFGIIQNNGSIEANSKQQTIETWCKDPNGANWPYDELKCSIDIAIDGKQLSIQYAGQDGVNIDKMTESSEWQLFGFEFTTKNFDDLIEKIGKTDANSKGVTFALYMKRNVLFYRKIFFTPLLVAAILILFSFVLKRFLRGILNLIALVLLLGMFLVLTHYTPSSYVPRIAHLYEAFLGIACFSYVLSILNRWLRDYGPDKSPPNCILAIVNNSILRYMLGMKFADSADYLKIQQKPWKQIGLILDRIIFVILLLFFATIFFIGFV